MSSYPTSATSPGTDTTAPYSDCSTPSASRSLAQNTAVGRGDMPSSRAPASRPDVTSSRSTSTWRSADSPSPRSRRARSAPSRRSRHWASRIGPLT
ncbi:hypothetical protein SANTM175S_10642 [Streptomyces antimycoticus]